MAATWEKLGTHSIRMNEDIVELRQGGTMTLADAIGYFDMVDVLIARYGYCLSLFDHSQGVSMEPSARARARTKSRKPTPCTRPATKTRTARIVTPLYCR